jgi:AraC-like DNA-binding protein
MHSDPARPWHLEDLAKATAMSRTTFAMYFKKVAGVGPLTYLTEWRMRLAEHDLREDKVSVSELAQSLGYTSDSAFSHAFKRVTGMAPKHYRIFSYAGNRREAQPRTDEHAFAVQSNDENSMPGTLCYHGLVAVEENSAAAYAQVRGPLQVIPLLRLALVAFFELRTRRAARAVARGLHCLSFQKGQRWR